MITETCGCGASITIPATHRGVLAEWRSGHRHDAEPDATAETDEPQPPMVDVKGASRTELGPRWDFDTRQPVRLGFRPNGEGE